MSLEDTRDLYKQLGKDENLQEKLESVKTAEDVIETVLEIADEKRLDVSRADIEALGEESADHTTELDEEELKNVAGGSVEDRWRRVMGDDLSKWNRYKKHHPDEISKQGKLKLFKMWANVYLGPARARMAAVVLHERIHSPQCK